MTVHDRCLRNGTLIAGKPVKPGVVDTHAQHAILPGRPRGALMPERAMVAIAIAGLALAGGPARAADLWVGTSTAQDAGTGRCGAVTFELTTDGATIGGTATSPAGRGPIVWLISGRRDGATVNFETQHRENVPDGRMQQIRWTGRISGDQMQISQTGQSVTCQSPRSALLRRSQ